MCAAGFDGSPAALRTGSVRAPDLPGASTAVTKASRVASVTRVLQPGCCRAGTTPGPQAAL